MAQQAAETQSRVARLARGPLDVATGIARALPQAVEELFRDRCPQYAASIAFHVFFSLFPLTILLVSIFGLVLQDDDLRASVIDELVDVLPVSQAGEQDVRRTIEEIASPLSAIGLVSLVALLWGASGMMAAIRVGLETALEVERGRPPAHAKLFDFLLVGAGGIFVLVVIGLSAFVAFFSRVLDDVSSRVGIDGNAPGALLRDGVQLFLIAVMALLLYRVLPGGKLGHRGALAGAILTAVGIWGAARLLAFLFDFSRYNVIYGSLAGVMAFLFFVYVAALILLLGAEFGNAWSKPPGPPGPPFGIRLKGFLRGLVRHPEPDDAGISVEPARRP